MASTAPTTGAAATTAKPYSLHDDIEKVLFSRENIDKRLTEIGAEITKDFQGKNPIVVGVLTGACMVVCDLVRHIDLPLRLDFMAASSYGNTTTSSGVVKVIKDVKSEVEGRHVILVEDMLDTGNTLRTLIELMKHKGATTVTGMVLLDKDVERKPLPDVKYIGFECPNRFIVGYGIDYAQRYRNLPYVGIVKPSVYERKAPETSKKVEKD